MYNNNYMLQYQGEPAALIMKYLKEPAAVIV